MNYDEAEKDVNTMKLGNSKRVYRMDVPRMKLSTDYPLKRRRGVFFRGTGFILLKD